MAKSKITWLLDLFRLLFATIDALFPCADFSMLHDGPAILDTTNRWHSHAAIALSSRIMIIALWKNRTVRLAGVISFYRLSEGATAMEGGAGCKISIRGRWRHGSGVIQRRIAPVRRGISSDW